MALVTTLLCAPCVTSPSDCAGSAVVSHMRLAPVATGHTPAMLQGISCADYCAVNACPGRAGRKNCKAGKASVCKAAFAKRPAAARTTTTGASVVG